MASYHTSFNYLGENSAKLGYIIAAFEPDNGFKDTFLGMDQISEDYYDGTKKFIEKYKDDGIIWYFDNFALKAEELFFVLWHMKQAGWFECAKGFVFGRTLFEDTFLDMSYEEAIQRALGKELPIITEADIGHVAPKFTIINGAIGHFIARNGKGSLEIKCEE